MNTHRPTTSLLLALALALCACSHRHPDGAGKAMSADARGLTLPVNSPQRQFIEIAAAEARPPLPPMPVPGRVIIDPKRTVDLGAPLAGRIETVSVRLGATVKKGDRLFSVRSGSFADLDRDIEVARSEAALKARLHSRSKELYELKAVPEKDLIEAEATLKESEASLRAVEAKRESLSVESGGRNLFWVRATRAGVLVDVGAVPGLEVSPERDKPLIQISDFDELLVDADFTESDTADLKPGGSASISSDAGGGERLGTIDYVSSVVDPQRRTVEVRIRLKNQDHALRPNAFVEVTPVTTGLVPRVRVHENAVVTQGTRSVVFVERDGARLEPRPVVLGRRRDSEVEIRSGLAVGERYVARGALLLLNQVELAE